MFSLNWIRICLNVTSTRRAPTLPYRGTRIKSPPVQVHGQPRVPLNHRFSVASNARPSSCPSGQAALGVAQASALASEASLRARSVGFPSRPSVSASRALASGTKGLRGGLGSRKEGDGGALPPMHLLPRSCTLGLSQLTAAPPSLHLSPTPADGLGT